MPTNPPPATVFEVAKRAIEISDPTDSDPRLGDLLAQFEDADEPVTAIQNLEERVALAVEGVDVEIEDPAVSMAAAAILYLAHRRDELGPPECSISRVGVELEASLELADPVEELAYEHGARVVEPEVPA